jgi:hypothetical protein
VLKALDAGFAGVFRPWMDQRRKPCLHLDYSTEAIVSYLMHHSHLEKDGSLDMLYPDAIFN